MNNRLARIEARRLTIRLTKIDSLFRTIRLCFSLLWESLFELILAFSPTLGLLLSPMMLGE